ncbi:type II toxin-antitoxin system Rv0910 family toxin [Nocardioides sp. SYSU DS0651]|uniref:type II toxin-antitoxin system Rv0910 family toxin n=1 Tax=Nocardioides sp. SYSU DS0651 TaxID=3415955 RepID=UPI003F4B1D14
MDLRKSVRSISATARWAKDNPGTVRDLLVGLVRPGTEAATAAPAGDREPPPGLADFDRAVGAQVEASGSAGQMRALVGDLTLLPDWMTIHAGWRGQVPPAPAVGVDFTEQVEIMGVPAEIRWSVVEASPDRVGMTGTGPMGLQMGLWFSVLPTTSGSTVRIDAGMGGEPLRGPLGGTIARTVHDEMEQSLARLVALHERGVEGKGGDGVAPVLHDASGRRLDPRTPVIVGVGQVVQREPAPDVHPAQLAAQALREAERDAGVSGLLARADSIYAVSSASWTYRDQAAAVAEELGVDPAETVQSAPYGGDAGQLLINDAGQAIAAGDVSVVLVCGAEAGNSFAAAQKQGAAPTWPEQPAGTAPTRRLGSDKEANNAEEGGAGLMAPIYVYALLETALRHKLGRSREEHQRAIAELWSRMSGIAARNPYAWQPEEHTPEQLLHTGEHNRMISAPYSKLLCANMQVDLASGIIVTSVAAAEAAGVPQDRWVFLHAGAAAHDEWFVSERGDLADSPAIRSIGRAALDHAGITIDDVAHVDLYSCFPVAVEVGAAALGLPVDDPERPLSLTGGLTFGGGPGNNYGGHGVAQLVQRLRENPADFGISTSLGWYVTKHALGVYSAQPPAKSYRALAPVLEPAPTRPVRAGWTGPAVVEAYTVPYGREGEPSAAIVSAVNDAGERVLLRAVDPATVTLFVDEDPLGWRVEVTGDSALEVLDRGRTAVPPPPVPPVLLDKRGPLWVITLNRPERRNAIDLATAQLLERMVDAFEADDGARVAILTGAGGTFSAGMDLKAAAGGQFPMTDRRGPLGITGAPISKPLIAAVEGHALAGGCELALVADLVVASTDSQFGLPEAKRGLVAAAGGVLRLAQRLPRNIALELALTGNPMPATRMAELGLVNRLAEPGSVLDAAVELAEELMVNAPISLQVSKQIVDSAPDWSTEEEFARQSELAGTALFSQDAAEGVAAFAEGRPPVWKGR